MITIELSTAVLNRWENVYLKADERMGEDVVGNSKKYMQSRLFVLLVLRSGQTYDKAAVTRNDLGSNFITEMFC